MNLKKFPHQELTRQIIGIYYHVYNELGYGFLEKVYHNAFAIELTTRGYKIEKHKKVSVFYKNEIVGEYIPDILVDDKLIIELKCAENLVEAHECQLINYLRATDCQVGLVLNFGKDPQFIRKIFTNDLKKNKNRF